MIVNVKRLKPEHPLPRAMSAGAAGYDVFASLAGPVDIMPGQVECVGTGFAIAIPPGFEAQIRPRSGLAFKHGLTVINTPGTIDSDYRGEIKVLLINLGSRPVTILPEDRIAQLVVCPVMSIVLERVDELDSTGRGSSGLGSTGT